jgi:DNA processing protein
MLLALHHRLVHKWESTRSARAMMQRIALAERSTRASVHGPMPRRSPYQRPPNIQVASLKEILADAGRGSLEERQFDLLRRGGREGGKDDVRIFLAGDRTLLRGKSVSIVGTRDVSPEGWQRASQLARKLASYGVVVVSGLAKGVDTAALSSAMEAGGRTIAVIGTPLSKAYPAENWQLQEEIWRHHLLMSPFAEGEVVFKSNFPKRNRVMAAISDASVIIEASDTSGTLHQAAECQRLGRWLFIAKSVAENRSLKWPSSFLSKPKTAVLEKTEDILAAIEQHDSPLDHVLPNDRRGDNLAE